MDTIMMPAPAPADDTAQELARLRVENADLIARLAEKSKLSPAACRLKSVLETSAARVAAMAGEAEQAAERAFARTKAELDEYQARAHRAERELLDWKQRNDAESLVWPTFMTIVWVLRQHFGLEVCSHPLAAQKLVDALAEAEKYPLEEKTYEARRQQIGLKAAEIVRHYLAGKEAQKAGAGLPEDIAALEVEIAALRVQIIEKDATIKQFQKEFAVEMAARVKGFAA